MNNEIKERKRKPIPSKKKEGSDRNMIIKGKNKPIPTKKKKNMMMKFMKKKNFETMKSNTPIFMMKMLVIPPNSDYLLFNLF